MLALEEGLNPVPPLLPMHITIHAISVFPRMSSPLELCSGYCVQE